MSALFMINDGQCGPPQIVQRFICFMIVDTARAELMVMTRRTAVMCEVTYRPVIILNKK